MRRLRRNLELHSVIFLSCFVVFVVLRSPLLGGATNVCLGFRPDDLLVPPDGFDWLVSLTGGFFLFLGVVV